MKPKPHFEYDINAVLQQRWSPRAFSEKMMTKEQALTLFEAARWAASCNNAQPWLFIWSLKGGSKKYAKLFDCLKPGNQEWAKFAPLLILTLVHTKFDDGKPNRWAGHDLGLAVGNLSTQATSMDLFVHSMAGFSADKVKEHFVLPDDVEPMTMIAVGYIGEPSILSEFNQKREEEPRVRKALKDMFL